MIRCCKCGVLRPFRELEQAQPPLPDDQYRCVDHDACDRRVRDIVNAHRDLAMIMNDDG